MGAQTTLRDSPVPVHIAPGGYTLHAPGLHATVMEMAPEESATRFDAGTHEPHLLAALAGAEVHPVKVFEVEVAAVMPPEATRSTRACASSITPPSEVIRPPSNAALTLLRAIVGRSKGRRLSSSMAKVLSSQSLQLTDFGERIMPHIHVSDYFWPVAGADEVIE
jgi:hypothetical protein